MLGSDWLRHKHVTVLVSGTVGSIYLMQGLLGKIPFCGRTPVCAYQGRIGTFLAWKKLFMH